MKQFRKILRHALGLDKAGESCRNWYASSPDSLGFGLLEEMEGAGLVKRNEAEGRGRGTGYVIFNVTELGKVFALNSVVKVLSVRQPWAWLLVNGFKDVENRSRYFKYRGALLIHASLKWHDSFEPWQPQVFQERLNKKLEGVRGYDSVVLPDPEEMERGGIVGVVTVTDCNQKGRPFPSPYYEGPCGVLVKDGRPLPFIPYKGQLGLFDYKVA